MHPNSTTGNTTTAVPGTAQRHQRGILNLLTLLLAVSFTALAASSEDQHQCLDPNFNPQSSTSSAKLGNKPSCEPSPTMAMPTLFVPHGGGPLPVLGDSAHASLTAFLKRAHKLVQPKPKALVVVTAHWESNKVTVSTNPKPDMLYDYGGFPKESYSLKYPAPGSPQVAQRVLDLLSSAGVPSQGDSRRGFDHGTFIPLMLMYPEADIPVVQVSLMAHMDPGAHLAMGRALAPLRQEGVLLLGSGMSYHNMQTFFRAMGGGGMLRGGKAPGQDFDTWLQESCVKFTGEAREKRLADWGASPGGREAHPREEHLIPLMVIAGAAGADPGKVVYDDVLLGARVSGFIFGADPAKPASPSTSA